MSSKALVINGANFAMNKVAKVNLEEDVPCTGITLSQSELTFTSIGATATLTVTKTPLDTTDTVVWASSNEDCATVADGVVTCVGVGSATITATCGTQSATCTVTSTYTMVLDTEYHMVNGYKYSGSMNLSANPPKNHIGSVADAKGREFYNTEEYGTYRAFVGGSDFAGQYLIPLPKGATSASIIVPTTETRHVNFILGNSNEKQTYVSGAAGNAAKGIANYVRFNNSDAVLTLDMSRYINDADGFILSWELISTSQTDITTITGTTSIVFS